MTNTEENIKKVKEIVLENFYVSLKELASELNFAYRMAQSTVVDILGMRCITFRLILKDLTSVQDTIRKGLLKISFLKQKNDPTFMKQIITSNERWIYEYNMEANQQ